MSSWLFFILLSWMTSAVPHDAVVAVFQLSESASQYKLEVTFDQEDFLSANNLTEDQMSVELIGSYLKNTTHWVVNQKALQLDVQDYELDNDHYRVTCTMPKVDRQVQTLIVENEFLVRVPSHSNLIMIDVNDRFRDFRMHEKRTKIEVVY